MYVCPFESSRFLFSFTSSETICLFFASVIGQPWRAHPTSADGLSQVLIQSQRSHGLSPSSSFPSPHLISAAIVHAICPRQKRTQSSAECTAVVCAWARGAHVRWQVIPW